MALEDRFREFARQQEEPVRPQQGPYERNIEYLKKVDAVVSRVLEAFCQGVGWSLKRNDCCDRAKGAVACNYILEHPDFWREGFLAVDVEVTWGARSDPLETATVYEGHIVGGRDHARDFASRVAIPFSTLTEDRLAAALEHQSGDVLKRISLHTKPQWSL